jgi:hypothetical protein
VTRIGVEPVPKPDRTPKHRYQVTVDGSVISRHRTKAQARERARQARGNEPNRAKNIAERAIEAAKVSPPVDATLETMGGSDLDEFAAGGGDREAVEQEQDPWGHVERMAMIGGGDDDDDNGGLL